MFLDRPVEMILFQAGEVSYKSTALDIIAENLGSVVSSTLFNPNPL